MAGAGIFDKLELEPHKNRPALQHWKIGNRYCDVYLGHTVLPGPAKPSLPLQPKTTAILAPSTATNN
jgi:hypothetical protein